MTASDQLLRAPGSANHVAHLHDDDGRSVVAAISRYAADGLRRGEGVVLIARPAHARGVLELLRAANVDTAVATAAGRLVVLDAYDVLDAILVDGRPDEMLFRSAVDPAVARARRAANAARVGVYGEMVGVLWETGRRAAALELESLWKRRLAEGGLALFCAYPIDVFSEEFSLHGVDALLCAHTHVVPAEDEDALARVVDDAMRAVLGRRADGLRLLIKPNFRPAWAALPRGHATILWLRNNLPEYADAILARAREASSRADGVQAVV